MVVKIAVAVVFILGLIYILIPGIGSVYDFPALPHNAIKSTESGDTVQIPNVEAFFSDDRRAFATKFYKSKFDTLEILGTTIPSLRINRPPEEAFQYIRDQQFATYLEEYTYPLRESFFINGIEPVDDNGNLRKVPTNTFVNGYYYQSKVTLRLYPTKVYNRVIVYLGIWVSMLALFYMGRKIAKERV